MKKKVLKLTSIDPGYSTSLTVSHIALLDESGKIIHRRPLFSGRPVTLTEGMTLEVTYKVAAGLWEDE
jgi:hypothetical protein